MRFCGVDVSQRPANQQLVTLEEEGGALRATFYAPGTVDAVARTVMGFDEAVVAVDAPSGPRLDLLAAGSALRDTLKLSNGRYERSRVCDALLIRRGLPLYPVPPAGEPPSGWQAWMAVGFTLFERLADLGRYAPPAGGVEGRADLRWGRLCETYPDAVFCALLGGRPSPKRTPRGARQRIDALRAYGVRDPDGDLWHRTLDELDACAAAVTAHALAGGRALWLGAPEEGVIVLPARELPRRFARLPPPVRTAPAD